MARKSHSSGDSVNKQRYRGNESTADFDLGDALSQISESREEDEDDE